MNSEGPDTLHQKGHMVNAASSIKDNKALLWKRFGCSPGDMHCGCHSYWHGSSLSPQGDIWWRYRSSRWRWPSPSDQTSSFLLCSKKLHSHHIFSIYHQIWQRRPPPRGTCSGCTYLPCLSPLARTTGMKIKTIMIRLKT